MTDELDISQDLARINALKAAAQQAHGQVYYETHYRREQRTDGSWYEIIDIHEKYREPNSESADLLRNEGVEVVFHSKTVCR